MLTLPGLPLPGPGLIKVVLQRIQPGIPELAVLLYPIRNLMQFFQLRLIKPFPALLFDHDQPAFRQYFDMLVYRSAAHIEIPGDRINVQRLMSDQADDLPTGRVGYRLKYISSHKMKPFGCKIVQTGRPTKIF